ncbi:hypothetical protein PMAYCL1PPCAC_25128, partial [Pristionchus mayeri]
LLPLLLLLPSLQLQPIAATYEVEPQYKPDRDTQAELINPNYRFISGSLFRNPRHMNGPIRDRWCQEKCMRHCYCTYGYSCRRSCIAHCDRGLYKGFSNDPFLHNRSKRSAKDEERLPSVAELVNVDLPYLKGFKYDDRAILRRVTGRPIWNPAAKDYSVKQVRVSDTRWGKMCQDPGN